MTRVDGNGQQVGKKSSKRKYKDLKLKKIKMQLFETFSREKFVNMQNNNHRLIQSCKHALQKEGKDSRDLEIEIERRQ